MSKPITYEVTVAGTVYRCQEVSMYAQYLIQTIGEPQPPNKLRLGNVTRIGTQDVSCPEVTLPLIDHAIRPVIGEGER